MVTGDHDFEAELIREARDQAEADELRRADLASDRLKVAHGMQWLPDWQYGTLWRFVSRPDDDSKPEFEPFGPDGLPGEGWELNVDAGENGIETRSPAQRDVLMQLTYWRRKHPGMTPDSPRHKVSGIYSG